jgi:plasmid maintenance system antidote protein VapI
MAQRRPSKPIPPRGPLFGWTHPGETVAEEMAARELAAAGFAAELGCAAAEPDGLLAGALPVMPALAAALERAWGAEAGFWMRLQANHDEARHPTRPGGVPSAVRTRGLGVLRSKRMENRVHARTFTIRL